MLPLETTVDEQEEWTENSAIIAATEAEVRLQPRPHQSWMQFSHNIREIPGWEGCFRSPPDRPRQDLELEVTD